jgi:hypothetical protein
MVEDTETFPAEMNVYGPGAVAEARKFREILKRHDQLPEGVRGLSFRLDEDSTGAPAVWIIVKADDDLSPSEAKVDRLVDFTAELRAEFRDTGTDRWPYTIIEAA